MSVNDVPLCPYCGDLMRRADAGEFYSCVSCGASTMTPDWVKDEEPTEEEMNRAFEQEQREVR